MKIIILYGPQGAGKSTYRTELMKTDPSLVCISTDDMLQELFHTEFTTDPVVWACMTKLIDKKMTEAVGHGLPIIYDTTLSSEKAARRLLEWLDDNAPHYARELVEVTAPLSVCLERNAQRSRNVPEQVIRDTYARIEALKSRWYTVGCQWFIRKGPCSCVYCTKG